VIGSREVPRTSGLDAPLKGRIGAGSAILSVGLVLGYLGWTLPTPGGSLVVPTLIVAGVGLGVCATATVVAFRIPRRRRVARFVGPLVILTLVASAWTFAFSLPARMAWDSSATARAKAILFGLNQGDVTKSVSPQPCTTVTAGSIGPLDAPYRECATSTAEGHLVTFTAVGIRSRGIAYTDRGPETFLDQCYKHLDGSWYMFTRGNPSTPATPCPIGYAFHGGP
jgi:hypothetical protein